MSGSLCAVGIGPGDPGYLTYDAVRALDEAELIVGYGVYINLLPEEYKKKRLYSTGMGDEVKRCEYALEKALEGENVAVVCSGDPGIYGMASLLLELAGRKGGSADAVDITIIPGVTAALSAAAILGAPIGNDFAVISLSTALTPWEEIEKRLKAAAEAGFVIVLYNPASRARRDTLKDACGVILEASGYDPVSGYVRNAGRAGQESGVMPLSELKDMDADMFTTVFIGNKNTRMSDDKMITGRKYLN